MGSRYWHLFLTFIFVSFGIEANENSDVVQIELPLPELSLPSSDGGVVNLSELKGKSLVVLWLQDCGRCVKEVESWNELFSPFVTDETLFLPIVWENENWLLPDLSGNDGKSNYKEILVLNYSPENRQAWWLDSAPAVMFISPDGVVEDMYLNSIELRKDEIADALGRMLSEQSWLYGDQK